MPIIASDVLKRVATILFDEGATRWPYVELVDWLNDALKEITLRAPQHVSKTVVIPLQVGTQQSLPAEYLSLLRVNANVTATGQVVASRGTTVRPITRAALDHQIPQWQNGSVLVFTSEVSHIIDDPAASDTFLVAPGNDGTGQIEALVAKRPDMVDVPSNPLVLDGYNTVIDIDEVYLSALVDFVVSKALTKDVNVQGGPQRAQNHYNMFASALGIKTQADVTINPNTGNNSKGG